VDTTSATLTAALGDAVFAAGAWTFGGTTALRVGDTLFLDMATQQDSDRAWQMIAANGNAGDFKPFGSDIDQAIANAVNAVKGNATTYTNLGLVEDKLEGIDLTLAAMQAAEGAHAKTIEYPVTWGTPDVNGVKTATIDTSADFNTHKVSARVLKVKAGGFYEQLSSTALLIESSNSAVRLQTDSGSITAATLVVIVSGTPEL